MVDFCTIMHQIEVVNDFMRNSMKIAELRRRGRPPAYDRDAALAALTGAFWDHGFAATPLDALAAATAMNRPSLYAAFGDKQAMYLAVLARYRADAEAHLRAALWSSDDVQAALAAVFAAAIDFYSAGPLGPRGCLAVGTAATEAVADADIRAALAAVLATLDDVIAERLGEAVAVGQLPPGFDPPARAALVAAMLHSLATRARSGHGCARLQAFVVAALPVLLA